MSAAIFLPCGKETYIKNYTECEAFLLILPRISRLPHSKQHKNTIFYGKKMEDYDVTGNMRHGNRLYKRTDIQLDGRQQSYNQAQIYS